MDLVDDLRSQHKWTQSFGEELANTISHAAGFFAALIGTPILLFAAWEKTSAAFFVGSLIYVATILLLYFGSTLYHIWPQTRAKHILQVVDHGAIYLLIAGTYTPFLLGPLYGPWGWTILALVWVLAIFGIVMKTARGIHRHKKLAMSLYLGMGWMILVAVRPLAQNVSSATLLWLVGGGIVYTAGVIFFVNERVRYYHFVWHLFVLGGTSCHFLAVLSYASHT
jgi:hemolysin III